jgi:molybdopterin molybdotransferase
VIRYEDLTSSQGPDGAKVFRLTGVLDDSDVSGGSGGVKDSPKSQDPPNRRSPKKSLSPGANIHPQAADYHQGQVILGAGEIITSSHIAILASCGCTRVPSIPLPVIRILATGDELVDPSAPPLPHQIRGSNHLSLSAELTAWGFTPKRINICDDRPEALEAEISSAIQDAQILILTGAVSKGLYDEIPHLLTTLGVTIHIHGVSQRPGKPLLIGEYSTPEGQKKLIMALPGNPVSALVNLRRYLVPALISRFTGYSDPGSGLTIPPGAEPGSESGSGFTTRPQPNTNPKPGPRRRASRWLAAQGFRLPLGQDLAFSPSLTYYPGVQVIATEQGLLAYPVQGNGSGDFFHLSKTSGFIIIPAKENLTKAGDLVHYLPWGV